MATNLGSFITRVTSRLKDPSFTSVTRAEIIAVINKAIEFYTEETFFFNDFTETVTLTQNDPALPALVTNPNPTLIFEKGGIVINYAQNRWPLTKVAVNEYDVMNVEGRGIPYAWTYRAGGWLLYYYPDAAYEAIIRGLKSYNPLVNDSDTNDFLNEGENMILYDVLSRLYAEFRQDDKMEPYYSARAESEKVRLKRKTHRLRRTGRLQIEEM